MNEKEAFNIFASSQPTGKKLQFNDGMSAVTAKLGVSELSTDDQRSLRNCFDRFVGRANYQNKGCQLSCLRLLMW